MNTQQLPSCSVDELLGAASVVQQQGRWDLLVQNNSKLAQGILQVQQVFITEGIHDASNYNIAGLMRELQQTVAALPVN